MGIEIAWVSRKHYHLRVMNGFTPNGKKATLKLYFFLQSCCGSALREPLKGIFICVALLSLGGCLKTEAECSAEIQAKLEEYATYVEERRQTTTSEILDEAFWRERAID